MGARAAARGAQGIVELAFVSHIDDPGEIGGFAIRRGGTGTEAAHAVAAAAHQCEDERQGMASDDRDMGRRRQVG